MLVGTVIAHTGVVEPLPGYRVFLAGVAVSALGAAVLAPLALVALVLGRPWWSGSLAGLLLPALVVGLVAWSALRGGISLFNDVTTDFTDPPGFEIGPAAGVPYPEAFRELQLETHPGLAPLERTDEPAAVFEHALAVVRDALDWQVLHANEPAGVIQALALSRIFRFPDDVVIRVSPSAGGGSRVDLRSRSRFGRGDLGANAARIERFLTALRRVPTS